MTMAKTMTGARAKIYIGEKLFAIANSINYSHNYGAVPVPILGRYTVQEIAVTSSEPINGSMSGVRVVGKGLYKESAEANPEGTTNTEVNMAKIQDLLTNNDYITITVVDRQTGKSIATIKDAIITGANTSIGAKDIANMSLNFIGIMMDDEGNKNTESSSASTF